MKALAIDYSINCPAICALSKNYRKWYVNYRKDSTSDYPILPNASIEWQRSYEADYTNRFIQLSGWTLDTIAIEGPDVVILEDYAFSGSGNITALAENVGIFKAAFKQKYHDIPLILVAPTKMKKFAADKGTANKDIIWESFVKIFPEFSTWPKLIHPKGDKITSPIADIADSYYLALYGLTYYDPKTKLLNHPAPQKTKILSK